MNGANYGATLIGQMFQQIDHLCTRMTIQTAVCTHTQKKSNWSLAIRKILLFVVKKKSETYVVGSSRNITVGLLINSNAIDKRFFCPPDKRFDNVY